MDDEPVRGNHLGDVVAAAEIDDCRLEFRFQRHTGELWCVTSGPLARIAHSLLSADGVALAGRHARQAPHGLEPRAGAGQRGRYAKWPRVRISPDLLIALRARGDALDFAWLYGEGYPFGGGTGWLPTTRRATLLERVQMWLSGRRGARVHYARHMDSAER